MPKNTALLTRFSPTKALKSRVAQPLIYWYRKLAYHYGRQVHTQSPFNLLCYLNLGTFPPALNIND